MKFPARVFSVVRETTKRFYGDRCPDKAATIAYYLILAALPMLGVLLFIFSRFFLSEEVLFQTLHLYTENIFQDLDPSFFAKTRHYAEIFSRMGVYGLIFSLVAILFLLSKTIDFINQIFKVDRKPKHAFLISRLKEMGLMFFSTLLFFLSFLLSNLVGAFKSYLSGFEIVEAIDPMVIALLDSFLLEYLVPALLTLFFFFTVYKYIPHVKVIKRAAFIAALVATAIWEVAKRIFAWYLANVAVYGRIQGTLAGMVGFILLANLGFTVFFWGVECSFVLNHIFLKRAPERERPPRMPSQGLSRRREGEKK